MQLNEKQKSKVIESLQRRLEQANSEGKKLTWNSFLTKIGSFVNVSTNTTYKGILNGILLSFTAMAYGGDPRFIGFSQAKIMGGTVRKGEKGTPIFRPRIFHKEDNDTGEVKKIMGGFERVSVFNVRQTNLIENGKLPASVSDNKNTDSAPIISVMDFTGRIDFKQIISDGCPYYSSLYDRIGMPPFEAFHNTWKHSESLLHELIHWTGHPKRLNRLHDGWTNQAEYSREELIACIGAALLLNHLNIQATEEMELNQTAYLQGWISYFKNDISILLEAAQDAVTSVNYLIRLSDEGAQEAHSKAPAVA